MRRIFLTATAAVAFLGAWVSLFAQAQPQHGPGHVMPMMQGQSMPPVQGGGCGAHRSAQPPVNTSAATRAFMAANDKMHREMAITYSGNADRDFIAGMIPHHQGAIDMARIVLQYGADPEVRDMAQAIIREQEREISQMRIMLNRLPTR